jgi:phage host-nuclease inhibitor protein Gam
MQLQPYYNQNELVTSEVTIRVNPDDRDRAEDLVLATSVITQIKDEKSFQAARTALGQLKALINEINDAQKSAKRPFTAVNNAIAKLGAELETPVSHEYTRIAKLVNAHVAKIEAAAQARLTALHQSQLEAQKRVEQAKELEAKAKNETELDYAKLNTARAELNQESLKTAVEAEDQVLVPGARVTHPWRFKLIDPQACVRAGGIQLLRVELDILACNDAVKAQLSIDPHTPPSLPGIEVTRETQVHVKAIL